MNMLIAIPSRYNWSGLEKLLKSLKPLGCRVVVYDNGYESEEGKRVLEEHGDVINAIGWPFYKMWNHAWETASEDSYSCVALLNDDIELDPMSLSTAAKFIENKDIGVVGLNYKRKLSEGSDENAGYTEAKGTYKDGGIWGCAFLVNAITWGIVPPIDERYNLWYGDDELFTQMNRYGYKTVIAIGAPVYHEASTTANKFPELMAKVGQDAQLYRSKFT